MPCMVCSYSLAISMHPPATPQFGRPHGICHAAGGPRRKWSGRTKHGATNGPPGPCKAATVCPPLPQFVPPCHSLSPPSNMDFLSAIQEVDRRFVQPRWESLGTDCKYLHTCSVLFLIAINQHRQLTLKQILLLPGSIWAIPFCPWYF